METQITKTKDVIIVRLKGFSDFESITSLDQTCQKYLLQKKVIFNLADLHFVGSSGISNLMEIIKKLAGQSTLKMCHVGQEFRRIFSHIDHLDFYENEDNAKESLSQSWIFINLNNGF